MNKNTDSVDQPANEPNLEVYITTDEFQETKQGLKHLLHLLGLAEADKICWKWVILCAHNTLQNSAVCLLTETYGGGALTEKSDRELLDRLNSDGDSEKPWPHERLADFPTLMERISEKTSINFPKKADLSKFDRDDWSKFWSKFDQGTDLFRLHKYRNEFIHFKSKSWIIEVAGLPRVTKHAVEAIEEITQSSSYSGYNRFRELELPPIIAAINLKLAKLKL